jgi:fimbrial chaperone protein
MRGKLVAGLAMLLVTAGAVASSGFALSPVGLTIKGRDLSGSVIASNQGTAPIILQVEVFDWKQVDGKDVRTESAGLVPVPALVRVETNGRQLIRIVPRPGERGPKQQAYRVVVSELPAEGAAQGLGAKLSLAMDIPVFLDPPGTGALKPAVAWEFLPAQAELRVKNAGTRYFRLHDVRLSSAGKELRKEARVVVLADSWLAIQLPAGLERAESLQVTGTDDDGQAVAFDVKASR